MEEKTFRLTCHYSEWVSDRTNFTATEWEDEERSVSIDIRFSEGMLRLVQSFTPLLCTKSRRLDRVAQSISSQQEMRCSQKYVAAQKQHALGRSPCNTPSHFADLIQHCHQPKPNLDLLLAFSGFVLPNARRFVIFLWQLDSPAPRYNFLAFPARSRSSSRLR